MLYRTVIIEDDSVITHLNRRYVEMDNRFCVVQTFSAAHPALFWLRSNPCLLYTSDRQSCHGAPAVCLGQAAGPLQQAGMEIKHVPWIGLPSRGAAQQQGQGAICHRMLGEIIIYNEDIPSLLHKICLLYTSILWAIL